jgi:hypothetical protein
LILASAAGLFIANHFQPFADRGFSSIAAVSKRLNVPVVAAFPNNRRRQAESVADLTDDRKLPWANKVALYASTFLVGFVVFVLGFCLVDPEIRDGLSRNPVDGIARILAYFRGR